MIYSYDKVYLRIAQRVLGEMLNYAVYDCGYELNEYYRLFTESSYSERFSKRRLICNCGNVRGRAGHSCDGCAG